ncbi:porin family protein [Maribacter sp. 2308TA10-17]|uniref:porin family protein n=1 Tax=Maribacter sp. 2308TA10-17 TaxID=3386276 RepID=UPI0039BC8781
MKKIMKVLVFMAIGLMSFTATAQFGAKGGLGFSSLLIKDNDDNLTAEFGSAGFSFHVGAGYEIDFGDQLSFEPAVLLTQKKSSFDLNTLVTFNFLYLEMPLQMKYYFLDVGDSTRLYGLGGSSLGFLLSAKRDNDKLNVGGNRNDELKLLDVGINFGAGAQFFDALNVDLSASIGVTNLSNDVMNGLKNKNSVVRLTVTYQFGE